MMTYQEFRDHYPVTSKDGRDQHKAYKQYRNIYVKLVG